MDTEALVTSLNTLCYECHETSREHGFWNNLDFDDVMVQLSKLMLITTEVAEAAEAVRNYDYENLLEELADICIRVFDFASTIEQSSNKYLEEPKYKVNFSRILIAKMEKNKSREYMHGKLA